MENMMSLEEAVRRIEELEKENAQLRVQLEYYQSRKTSGRKNIMRNGWKFTMTLSCAMKQA